MATAVTDELKKELMSRGIWSDFVRVREDLGATGAYATSRLRTVAALERLAPDLVERVRPRGRPRGMRPSPPEGAVPPSPPVPSASAEVASGEVSAKNANGGPAPEFRGETPSRAASLADARREGRERRMGGGAAAGASGVGVRVAKSMFEGKTCSISKAFMWAYSNLCFEDASPEDAPSAVAWQMYCDMKTSPSLKADMLKSGLGAAMRKAEAEDETNERFDGERVYNLASAILQEVCG